MLIENNFILALILTALAGLATVVGAFLAFLIKRDNLKALSVGLAFSAGVMIFIALTELLLESKIHIEIKYAQNARLFSYIAFFCGIGLASLIDYFMPAHIEGEQFQNGHSHHENEEKHEHKAHEVKRAGVLTAVTLAMHRIPEGMATFFIASTNLALGIPLVIAIAIHNLPEGMAIALPVYNATGKKRTAIFYSVLTSLAGPFGAVLGLIFLKSFMSQTLIGALFGLVAGIMIYISLDTLLPLAREFGDNHHVIIGIVSGMLFIALSLIFLG